MTKRIIAVGRTVNCTTTTIYAPVQQAVSLYAAHAVRLWSELDALAAMAEASSPGATGEGKTRPAMIYHFK